MDLEIKNELLKDLQKAFSSEEKLGVVSIFLEQLAETSVALTDNSKELSKFTKNITSLSLEQQNNLLLIAQRVENTEKHLANAFNQLANLTKHLASLEESQTRLLNQLIDLYEKLDKTN